jgi:flagellar basal body P-ring formation protein FlgA
MMNTMRALMLGVLLVQAASVRAAIAMEDAVLSFVRQQTAAIAGRVDIQVHALDSRIQPLVCHAYEPFMPSGSRLWGRATVGVRCADGGRASVFVPVTVRIYAPVLVAAHPLASNQVLSTDDVRMEEAEITQPGLLTDAAQAVGRRIATGVNAGFPLRQDMLRTQQVIGQGDSVKVQVAGAGFAVSADGVAVAHATDGQTVQVRMESGRTISGTARAGRVVEVHY